MNEITNFIIAQRQLGVPDETSKSQLMQAGWGVDQINQAIYLLDNPTAQTQMPTVQPSPAKKKYSITALILTITLGVIVGTGIFLGYVYLTKEPTDSPAAQTSEDSDQSASQAFQQDADRKNDVSTVIAYADIYAANMNGKYPASADTIVSDFERFSTDGAPLFTDPQSKEAYKFVSTPPEAGEIQYLVGAECDGQDIISSGGHSVAARVMLSDGGYYCEDNN